MKSGASAFLVRLVNLLTLLVSLAVVGSGTWLGTRHNACEKFLILPVLAIGAFAFVISLIGFIGSVKEISVLIWIYLMLMFLLLLVMASFTIFAFIITNTEAGHTVSGQRYKEYRLEDYSQWLQKRVNNTNYWNHLRSCLMKSNYCNDLSKEYRTLKQYQQAKLTPIEAGCCKPPSECGYVARNASYYDLRLHPVSSNKDCKLYKNKPAIKCYNCNSCKAGVAHYLKREWRFAATVNMIVLTMLVLLCSIGCCARRNVKKYQFEREPGQSF